MPQKTAHDRTNNTLTCTAYAKLNLFLQVLDKRLDGYHNLATLFTLLDWGDDLRFMLRQDNKIYIHGFSNIAHEDNLIHKAVIAFRRFLSNSGQVDAAEIGVEVWVNKRIPQGAGLGGGSSNAASTLLALNQLLNTKITTQQLQHIAVGLGADVSVFIAGFPLALATGKGDCLTQVHLEDKNQNPLSYLVLFPDVHCSSAELFSCQHLPRHKAMHAPIAQIQDSKQVHWNKVNQLSNDFSIVLEKQQEIQQALLYLHRLPTFLCRRMAIMPRISGSGSSVFVAFYDGFWGKVAQLMLQCQLLNSKIGTVLVKAHFSVTDLHTGV